MGSNTKVSTELDNNNNNNDNGAIKSAPTSGIKEKVIVNQYKNKRNFPVSFRIRDKYFYAAPGCNIKITSEEEKDPFFQDASKDLTKIQTVKGNK